MLEHHLLTVVIGRLDCLDNGLHALYRLLLELLNLLFKYLSSFKSNFVLPVLDILPVECVSDLVFTEVLLDSQVFVKHLVLCEPRLLERHKLVQNVFLIQSLSYGLLPLGLKLNELLLLPLELPDVVVSPQGSDLKNVLKVWELFENFCQVLLVDAEDLRSLLSWLPPIRAQR